MAQKTRTYLKGRFETGDVPTEADFIDLIDTLFSNLEDTLAIAKLVGVTAFSDDETLAGDSATVLVSQRAIKAYVDAGGGGGGGSATAHDALSVGTPPDAFTAKVKRQGGTLSTMTSPSTGVYTVVMQSGAEFFGADLFGKPVNTNAGALTINIDNSANARDLRLIPVFFQETDGSLVSPFTLGLNVRVTIASNITTITLANMNGFDASGFHIQIR